MGREIRKPMLKILLGMSVITYIYTRGSHHSIIYHSTLMQNELVAYKAKYGNYHVPTKYKDNKALGRWVSTQRAEYKKYQEGQAKTSMNAGKIRRLESIGFAWFMAL